LLAAYLGVGVALEWLALAPIEPRFPPSASEEVASYRSEGVWGSYKTHPFRDGIHGLPHVRPWRT